MHRHLLPDSIPNTVPKFHRDRNILSSDCQQGPGWPVQQHSPDSPTPRSHPVAIREVLAGDRGCFRRVPGAVDCIHVPAEILH